MMSAQLVAPRPLRLSGANRVPFFLSNQLSAPRPVSPPTLVGAPSAANDCGAQTVAASSMDPQPSSVDIITNKDDQEMAIEDLAARICLDDDVGTTSASKELPIGIEPTVTSPNRTIIAEEIAKISPRYAALRLPGSPQATWRWHID